jgi:hypothetical protein
MNSKDWYRGLEHPESLGAVEAAWLKQAVEEYPYSAPLHALYARALKNEGHYLAPQALRRAAAVAPDRRALMTWMEGFSVPTPVAEVSTPPAPHPAIPAPSPIGADAEEPKVPELPTVPQTISPEAPYSATKVLPEPQTEPVAKPEASSAASDLSHLPEKVREAILRARSLSAKMHGSTPSVPAPAVERQQSVTPAQQNVASVAPIDAPAPPVDAQVPAVAAVLRAATPATPSSPAAPAAPALAVPQTDALPQVSADLDGAANRGVAANSGLSPFARWLAEQAGGAQQTPPSDAPELEESLPQAVPAPLESDAVNLAPTVPKPMADALIDKFLERETPVRPAAVPGRGSEVRAPMPDLSASSLGGDPVFMTETLAQVYVQQGAFDKAVQAYEILRLKYPDKSAIFASLILEIRLKQRNKKP